MWNVDEAYETFQRIAEMEQRLLRWRLSRSVRDQLIREASAAGLRNHRIAALMGMSRQTVGRVLDGDPRALRQAPR